MAAMVFINDENMPKRAERSTGRSAALAFSAIRSRGGHNQGPRRTDGLVGDIGWEHPRVRRFVSNTTIRRVP